MFSRPGRISLLLFQLVWLNVILPGHTRGAVTLPQAGTGGACCGHRENAGEKSIPPKPAKDPAHCAVCFFAARLTLPENIDLTPPPLNLLAILTPQQADCVTSIALATCFDGRAPPLA
ncbi:MAG TPA: hypothetical protein VF669_23175 [Tepidisphaeraceae bacterium]|jgi:hypothetical protein